MSSVGTRDTGAEVALREALHRLGYRYRIARIESGTAESNENSGF